MGAWGLQGRRGAKLNYQLYPEECQRYEYYYDTTTMLSMIATSAVESEWRTFPPSKEDGEEIII